MSRNPGWAELLGFTHANLLPMDHAGPAPGSPGPDSDAAVKITGNNGKGNILMGSCRCREEGFPGKVFGNSAETSTVYPGLDISCKPRFQRQRCRVPILHLSPGREASPPLGSLACPTHQGNAPLSRTPRSCPCSPARGDGLASSNTRCLQPLSCRS